jgi:NADPH-dependent curcumin reductase CurA
MAPVTNGRLLFNSVPTGMQLYALMFSNLIHQAGYPEPGKTTAYDTTETIDLETVLLNGGLLVKTLELSVDPYLRGRMREATEQSYTVSVQRRGY